MGYAKNAFLFSLLAAFSSQAFSMPVNEASCLATYAILSSMDGVMTADEARSINKLKDYRPQAKPIFVERASDFRSGQIDESELRNHASQCNDALGLDFALDGK